MLRLTDGEFPFELDDPTGDMGDDIPSWPAIIQDAASEAKYFLRVGGAAYAYQYYREALKQLIDMHTWRSEEAAKVLLRIQRQMMAEVPLRDEITALSDLPLHLTN